MPTPAVLNGFNNQQTQQNGPAAPPPEDRYAALKDLDNARKAQPTLDWNSGSTSSLYSSSTPAGSLYSSPSPQGSPSQGQFTNLFPQEPVMNPFNSNIWSANGNLQPQMNGSGNHADPNPFRTSDPFIVNGAKNFQNSLFSQAINGTTWTPNPFKVRPFFHLLLLNLKSTFLNWHFLFVYFKFWTIT